MITALLALVLLFQGIPVRPNEGGSVTGILRNAAGRPAAGVRVGALAPPESPSDLAAASAMVSIGETDEAGRYRLENIPPGRYYIAAGRVDLPTYYPGTQSLVRGTLISITSAATVSGIDFAMADTSVRVDDVFGSSIRFTMPVQVTVEGGAKLPVFSPRGFPMLRLTNTANGTRGEASIGASEINVPSSTAEYRISIENLPDGYVIKSMAEGATVLPGNTLKVSSVSSPQPVRITLSAAGLTPRGNSGVRVTGHTTAGGYRSVFLSGVPGTFYSDGSFEFSGVQPGRYAIATLDNHGSTRPVAASVVVGDRDVEGVVLVESATLPSQIGSPAAPGPAGTHLPGTVVPLVSLHVAVVDEMTREPAGPGSVFILGSYGTSFDLPGDGRFELSRLLPGEYRFEIQAFRHTPITKTVVIGDEDVTLELTVQ